MLRRASSTIRSGFDRIAVPMKAGKRSGWLRHRSAMESDAMVASSRALPGSAYFSNGGEASDRTCM